MASARQRECLLSVWKGVTARELIHTLGVVGKQRFLLDFGVNFLPEGTPGASRAPLGDQVAQRDLLLHVGCMCLLHRTAILHSSTLPQRK